MLCHCSVPAICSGARSGCSPAAWLSRAVQISRSVTPVTTPAAVLLQPVVLHHSSEENIVTSLRRPGDGLSTKRFARERKHCSAGRAYAL